VNGLRSVYEKGGFGLINKLNPDIFCFQEIKTQLDPLKAVLLKPKGYFLYFNCSKRKGMWGVAVLTRKKPIEIKSKIGMERFEKEGRFLELKYSRFILINFYAPHGGRKKENLDYKLKVFEKFLKYLEKIKNENVILAGDLNVAHKEIDLARPKENENNTMFTLKERAKIDKIIKLGFFDSFREFCKEGGHFTWWPYGFRARERNLGWRIDYIFVSKPLLPKLKDAFILSEVKGSDHCPVGIEIAL